MQQPENLPPGGAATGEALNREVLTIESTPPAPPPPPLLCAQIRANVVVVCWSSAVREARDLLAADLMSTTTQ
jgi:hypothetical protein